MKQEDFEILKDIGDKIANKRKENQALLDDFAKAAMQGILSAETEMRAVGHNHTPTGAILIAMESYDIAEALMQERERRMEG